MSKNLNIIRHGKSDWSHECADFDRGLNKRGYSDTNLMGKYLLANSYQFEQVFCSTARRAKLTLQELNRYLKIPKNNIQYIDALYLAGRSTLVSLIENIDNEYHEVAIVVHNPGLTELCYYLSGDYLPNLPTCGVYSIHFDIDNWQSIGCESGTTTKFITPRQLKDLR